MLLTSHDRKRSKGRKARAAGGVPATLTLVRRDLTEVEKVLASVRPDFEKPYSGGLPQQGGSTHSITPKALRQFVIDHLERIEFRVKPQSLQPLPVRCVRVTS
jgi:hypothetical protein